MKMKAITRFVTLLITTILMASCATAPYRQADERVNQTSNQIAADKISDDLRAPPVIVRPGFYIDAHPVDISKDPAWLRRSVTLRAQNVPLNVMVARLLRNADINVRYDDTVQPTSLVSMHYNGTVKGALDTLAAKTRLYYSIDGNVVSWSAFQTKMFDISFMPGYSSYMVGRGNNTTSGFSNAYLGSGEVQSDVNDDQYSNLQAQLSVWEDLRNSLSKLVSPEGQYMISEATTTVTVHDHPDNVDAIGKYLDDLNKTLSQQVAIKVEVLDVRLTESFNMGINWDAVIHALNTSFTLSSSLASATVLNPLELNNSSTSAISSFIIGDGKHQTFINALNLQGKVQVVTNPQVVTMNNQIASIRITNDTSYVKSVSTTNTPDSGTTSSITPGTVTDGFTLYILPKIQGDKVFMQLSSTLSDLLSITKQDNAPANVPTNQLNSFVAIQTPTLTQKVFNQRTRLKSGDTLIVAGYRRVKDQTANAKLFEVEALGAKGSESQNIETLVLITPIILK